MQKTRGKLAEDSRETYRRLSVHPLVFLKDMSQNVSQNISQTQDVSQKVSQMAEVTTPRTPVTRVEPSLCLDYWMGDIEKTSFDQVIFSSCGKVFKKGIAWDGKSSWMVFDRKDGIFQWVLTEEFPEPGLYDDPPVTMNVNNLWWNFQMFERFNGEEPGDPDKISVRLKIFAGQWKGSWSQIPFQRDLVSDDGETTKLVSEGNTMCYSPHDQDYEFYNKSYPLRELPIYDPRQNTWEDHEGWTHCLEEPDWVENMVSYDSPDEDHEEGNEEEQLEEGEIRQDSPKKDNMEDLKKKAEAEERARGLFQEVEVREDPFDGELYTKKEFVDYYGTTLQWDFMTEEKTFKRAVLGKWILDNGSYMRPEATNYLLDKMIETFL